MVVVCEVEIFELNLGLASPEMLDCERSTGRGFQSPGKIVDSLKEVVGSRR
jgi:hypothetical protein